MIKELEKIEDIIKITLSNPFKKDGVAKKIVLTKIENKNQLFFYVEKFVENQSFHKNLGTDELLVYFEEISKNYKQICVVLKNSVVSYLSNGKNTKRLEKKTEFNEIVKTSQNRQKNYILKEGSDIPVFVDLGIFTKEHKIVNSMFDKYKQINKFIEIIDCELANFGKDNITILDFGCGKSYLTFVVYYYFSVIKNMQVKIIGYDLKTDVVNNCNNLAKKYGYDNLIFEVADVTKDKLADCHIDAVISLHACDIATDYALYFALSHNVKYIFSVPCCQHEINNNIQTKTNGDLDFLTRYGILKERTSALLTDSIRAMILEDFGYSVDVMEFVDLSHSPKNLMIKAEKNKKIKLTNREKIAELSEKYGFKQTLFELTKSLL